jgi:hypothetical protein
MAAIVTRDGQPVSPLLDDENTAYAWLLKHQPMSTDWAMEHEGYAIVAATTHLCDDKCGDETHAHDGRLIPIIL